MPCHVFSYTQVPCHAMCLATHRCHTMSLPTHRCHHSLTPIAPLTPLAPTHFSHLSPHLCPFTSFHSTPTPHTPFTLKLHPSSLQQPPSHHATPCHTMPCQVPSNRHHVGWAYRAAIASDPSAEDTTRCLFDVVHVGPHTCLTRAYHAPAMALWRPCHHPCHRLFHACHAPVTPVSPPLSRPCHAPVPLM